MQTVTENEISKFFDTLLPSVCLKNAIPRWAVAIPKPETYDSPMTMRVTQYGEPILREKGDPVEDFGPNLQALANDMLATLNHADGIGLAAPQVGLKLRFCVVDLKSGAADTGTALLDGRPVPPQILMPLYLANPEVEFPQASDSEEMEEGCLSIQGIRGFVERPYGIVVSYRDLEGQPHTLACEGLLARCIQHEVDHLNGVLFVDRMTRKDFLKIRGKLKRLKRLSEDLFRQGTPG